MFGLMRGRGEQRRLHYCGTCKTIGQQYGHAARLLLNHDAVFLAELLTHLAGTETSGWDHAYQQRACWAKPVDLPEVLQYAAAVTVFLADAKISDHVQDTRQRRWLWAQRWLGSRTRLSEQALAKWQLPLADIRRELATQTDRERCLTSGWTDWASPTATVTGQFFGHGAGLIGHPELAEPLAKAGRRFGELVYLLDAWEDYDRDVADGSFNALHAEFGERRRAVVEVASAEAERSLRALGCELFAARLKQNVAGRLGLTFPILCQCRVPRLQSIAVAGHGGVMLMTEGAGPKVPKPSAPGKSRNCGCGSCGSSDCSCCEVCAIGDCCCDCSSCCEGASCCECGSCCDCGSCDCS